MTVVIELPGGEGIIRGADGEIALTHDVTLEGGQTLQPWDRYLPLRIGLDDDRMLFGGLLPPGAVSVEAVEATGVRKAAAVGGGAYAVIFEDGEHGDPALGYRDAAGAWVHRPMPAEYPHHPVTDAEEPCPVCGAVDYEEYLPTEEWRGGHGVTGTDTFQPDPLIVCRVCGHQEPGGGIMEMRRVEDTGEDDATRAARLKRIEAEQTLQRWYANRITLMAVDFPVYAAEGWPATINGSSSQGDDLASLVIAHAHPPPTGGFVARPSIEVTTSVATHQPGALALARAGFAASIAAEGNRQPTDGLSPAALTLWFRALNRRRVTGAFQASVSDTEISIDGAPAPFVTVGTPEGRWVAVRRHHDVTVTIAAREITPASLILEPIGDLNARLLGPKPEEP